MAISIQNNVNSLIAQENLRANTDFQGKTIQRLTSGYRINASGDDAAGLAVANKFRSDTTELTQGVRNANDAISQLQIVDGGLSNISKILDRMKTLATQSASTTFTGSRTTLNNEYQSLLSEIDRQATNVKMNTGGDYNTKVKAYIGGASSANSDAMVTVDLSQTSVDTTSNGLNLQGTSVLGGGTGFSNNTVRLDDPMAKFAIDGGAGGTGHEDFTISYIDSNGAAQKVTAQVAASASGVSGTDYVKNLNSSIAAQGITGLTAQIGGGGKLEFVGSGAFAVTYAPIDVTGASQAVQTGSTSLTNQAQYSVSGNFANFTAAPAGDDTLVSARQQTLTISAGGKDLDVTLSSDTASTGRADTITNAVASINNQLVAGGITGVKALQNKAGDAIIFQSSSSFTVYKKTFTNAAFGNGGDGNPNGGDAQAGSLFDTTAGASVAVTAADTTQTATGNALSTINAIASAVSTLGVVQGRVGTGQNQLGYAINLAQSQISNFSAAESRIRDTDVAAEAANLTKASVLSQASMAAMAQANSAPQAVLALLRG